MKMSVLEFISLICLFQITYSCGKSIQEKDEVHSFQEQKNIYCLWKISRETPENGTGCGAEFVPYEEGNIYAKSCYVKRLKT